MKRERRSIPKIKPKIAVLVDGETEMYYMDMLNKNEKDIQFSIKPELPQKKSIREQYKKVVSLKKEGYDTVFWIIDFDVVRQDNQVRDFQIYLPKAKKKGIVPIINNPCLEYWFLIHFVFTQKVFNKCDEAEKMLKNHLKDYEKTEKYFKKNDIYFKLKDKLSEAIENSRRSAKVIEQETEQKQDLPAKSFSEMYLFFDYIKKEG